MTRIKETAFQNNYLCSKKIHNSGQFKSVFSKVIDQCVHNFTKPTPLLNIFFYNNNDHTLQTNN